MNSAMTSLAPESASVDSLRAHLPSGFVWGVGTASFRVEGAPDADGRGASVWDRPSDPRRSLGVDHFHRMYSDVRLLARLGVDAYRFSIAWPRILPDGIGPANAAGLDFYDRIVDALLEAGIEPRPTLYHWDLPQALDDVGGGWTRRDTAAAFGRYAAVVVEHLGDRVGHWTTMHAPGEVAMRGHLTGEHPPGRRGLDAAFAAAHHLLLGHGAAVRAIRSARPEALVGLTLGFRPTVPDGDSPFANDRQRVVDEWTNHWFADPIDDLGYPLHTAERLGWKGYDVLPGDLDLIRQPVDFLGVAYLGCQTVGAFDPLPTGTEASRPDHHEGRLTLLLRHLHETYSFPTYEIVECAQGLVDRDRRADGSIDDTHRIDLLASRLHEISDAVRIGVPVESFFTSLFDDVLVDRQIDTGLVEVDRVTLARRPKASAAWFRQLVGDRSADRPNQRRVRATPEAKRPDVFESRDHYLELLRRLDAPVDRALERVGIDPASPDAGDILTTPETFFAFTIAVDELADDPDLAIRIGREGAGRAFEPHYMSFDPPLFGAYMSPTWTLLVERIARYSAQRSPIGVDVSITDEHVTLEYVWPAGTVPSAMVALTDFVYWIEIGRIGTGTDFVPEQLVTTAAPPEGSSLERYFGVPIEVGAHHRLVVSRAVADLALADVDPALWDQARSAIEEQLDQP